VMTSRSRRPSGFSGQSYTLFMRNSVSKRRTSGKRRRRL
jgi:hypothetical protein